MENPSLIEGFLLLPYWGITLCAIEEIVYRTKLHGAVEIRLYLSGLPTPSPSRAEKISKLSHYEDDSQTAK